MHEEKTVLNISAGIYLEEPFPGHGDRMEETEQIWRRRTVMQHYYQTIDGGIYNNRYYTGNTGKYFASPLKDFREQTVLVETAESKNDSYR